MTLLQKQQALLTIHNPRASLSQCIHTPARHYSFAFARQLRAGEPGRDVFDSDDRGRLAQDRQHEGGDRTTIAAFPMELFDQLEDRALALGHAQTVYESAQQPPAILQTLSDEASMAHDVALAEVNTLVKRGLISDTGPKQPERRQWLSKSRRRSVHAVRNVEEQLEQHRAARR